MIARRRECIEIFEGKKEGEWFWHVRAANGKIADTGGEPYTRAWNAKRAATHRYPKLEVVRL